MNAKEQETQQPAQTSHTLKEEDKYVQSTEETQRPTESPSGTQRLTKPHQSYKFALLEKEGISSYHVSSGGIFKLSPQLELHQGLNCELPTIEVKVKLEDAPNSKSLWESLLGYAKRDLLILNGYMYLLERCSSGLFVEAIWPLAGLFRIYYDSEYEQVRLVFEQDNKVINRDFCTKYKQGFLDRLRAELEKLGRSID